jgi:TonB family protein
MGMDRARLRLLSGLICVLRLTGAWADFPAAMKDYNAGNFEAARAQFQALAELGDAASQFNLGAMAMKGQAGPKDMGAAVGWLSAAQANGSKVLAPEKLAAMRANLGDAELKTADEIASRYGAAGLRQTVLPLPAPGSHCPGRVAAHFMTSPASPGDFYPPSGRRSGLNGFVILELTIGTDGVPRDPEVLMSVPNDDFANGAMETMLRTRWKPATEGGIPVVSSEPVRTVFTLTNGGVLWNIPVLQQTRERALTGDPSAQYRIGLAATLDSSLGIPENQAQALLLSSAQGGNPSGQYWAAKRFTNFGDCQEDKRLPWLRAAAQSGNGAAQINLAETLVRGTPSPDQLMQARALIEQAAQSDDFYVMKHVAAVLGASPLLALRDPATAQTVAERLMKDSIEADPLKYEAAAVAYAANRKFWEAATGEQLAIKHATQLGWNTGAMQQRLALYRRSQAWTGDLFAAASAGAPAH